MNNVKISYIKTKAKIKNKQLYIDKHYGSEPTGPNHGFMSKII